MVRKRIFPLGISWSRIAKKMGGMNVSAQQRRLGGWGFVGQDFEPSRQLLAWLEERIGPPDDLGRVDPAGQSVPGVEAVRMSGLNVVAALRNPAGGTGFEHLTGRPAAGAMGARQEHAERGAQERGQDADERGR